MKPGLYVVEGIDGSGKSSAVKIISAKLIENNIPHVVIDSYPHTEEGKYLRKLWITQSVPPISVLGIVLYLRGQLIRDVVLPALAEGKVVIADRWMPTTRIYQSDGEGIPRTLTDEAIKHTLKEFSEHPQFDLLNEYNVFMMDVDADVAYARVTTRGNLDAFEKKPLEYFKKLVDAYDQCFFACTKGKISYIDAGKNLEDLAIDLHVAMKEMQ